MTKCLGAIICFFFFSFASSAQNNKWITYFENDTLEILQQTIECHDVPNGIHQQYIFLKLVNKTQDPIRVAYQKQLWYNGKCTTCNNNNKEQQFSVILNPQENLNASCENKIKALSIFVKMLDMKKSELTKFELNNITITTTK